MILQPIHDTPLAINSTRSAEVRPPVPLPLVPRPTIGCPVCGHRAYYPCLLRNDSGRTYWECGYCHPEVIASGGYECDLPDVAALRRAIADMAHGRAGDLSSPGPDRGDDRTPAQADAPGKPQKTRLDLYRIPPKEDARPWPLYYFDPGRQVLLTPDGLRQELDTMAIVPLLEQVARDPKQRVLVVGGDDAATSLKREWYGQAARAGWEVKDQHRDRKMLFFERDKQWVNLYVSALWFARIPDVDTLKAAYEFFERLLRTQFNLKSYSLLSTPTKAGRDLLLHSLPFESIQHPYPALPEAERELLYTIAYQGRMETFKFLGRETIDDLYCLDGVFMYASCADHLPVGPCLHDRPGEMAPRKEDRYIRGFYRATFRIPETWAHIGLIKVPKTREEPPNVQRYPNTPGMRITNWVSFAELYLAWEHGWDVTIHERLLWPETDKVTDPLATWIKHLRAIRAAAKQHEYGELSPYIADGDRAITLGTIGAFNRHQTFERSTVPYTQAWRIPAGVYQKTESYGIDYYLPKKLDADKWAHPEWALTVWGRARARLAQVALQLPYDSLLALRTDGIWTNTRPGAYDNQGNPIAESDPKCAKPGSWRVKEAYHRRVNAPDGNTKFVSMIQKLRATREEEVAEFEMQIEEDGE